MRVLIINLTRFGDVLQTQPVVHALTDGGHEVGFACLDNFAEAAALLDGVQALFPLHGGRLLATLDADWRRSVAVLSDFGMMVRRFAADRVLNLTSTLSARLLARLLAGSRPVGGFSVDEQGFGDSGTLWGAFLEASTLKRGCSPYNLADTFRKTAGVGDVPARFALRRPSPHTLDTVKQLLARETGSVPPGGYMAFQLGASDARRRWPTAHFAVIGRLVLERCGVMPILVGTPDERELGAAYLAAGSPAVNLIGRTSLEELSAVLALGRLLITNDTGTMHLAAGLGTPSLALFLATAQPWDTGPFLEDCCCVEPALACHPCDFSVPCPEGGACRERLTPAAIWPLVQERLLAGRWPEKLPAHTRSLARVWLTTRDKAGFLDLRSLSGHEQEERSLWLRMQRHFYRQFLDAADTPLSRPAAPRRFLPFPAGEAELMRGLSAERRGELRDRLMRLEALCDLLVRQGQGLTAGILPQGGKRFLGTAARIAALLQTGDKRNAFDALNRLWTVALQKQGGDLASVMAFAECFGGMAHAWAEELAPGA